MIRVEDHGEIAEEIKTDIRGKLIVKLIVEACRRNI